MNWAEHLRVLSRLTNRTYFRFAKPRCVVQMFVNTSPNGPRWVIDNIDMTDDDVNAFLPPDAELL